MQVPIETKYLIVNPNSTEAMTQGMASLLDPLAAEKKSIALDYFTAPAEAPEEITGDETSHKSCEVCLPLLLPQIAKYDGILICCYSKHPLIEVLNNSKEASENPKTTISGIFQSSLVFAVSKFPNDFLILTSNEDWVKILNKSVHEFFGIDLPNFKGTYSSKVNPAKLQDPDNFQKLLKRVQYLLDLNPRVKVILLGCAGFSGMENDFEKHFKGIKFVDSVKIGFKLLEAFN